MLGTTAFGFLSASVLGAGFAINVPSGQETSLTTTGTATSVSISGTLKLADSRLSFPASANAFTMPSASARLEQSGGVTYGAWGVTRTALPSSKLKYATGSLMTKGSPGYATRILRDGAEFWTQDEQPFRTEASSGSTLVACGTNFKNSNKTSSTPVSLLFDGATFRIEGDYGAFSTGEVRFEIGANGMTLDTFTRSAISRDITLPTTLGYVTDNGTKGPLTLRGQCNYKFSNPLNSVGGTVTLTDGQMYVNNVAAFYATGATPFGSGDLVLGTATLVSNLAKSKYLKLANGSGAKLRLKGAATLGISSSSYGTHWEIGLTGATESPIVREKGTALFFGSSQSTRFFTSSTSACTIRGAIPLNGKLPVWPLLVYDKSSSYSGDGSTYGEVEFLACSTAGVVSRYTSHSTSLGTDKTAVVRLSSSSTLSAARAAAALDLCKGMTLTVNSTLTLGNGTGTACLLLNKATVAGTGTIDFGSAEGVISSNARGGTISPTIAGTGGLTVVGTQYQDYNAAAITLAGANTYSGGTYISGFRVIPKNDAAFGTDDVWVRGGDGNGGQIYFVAGTASKITLTNGLHLSGRGLKHGGGFDSAYTSERTGAVWARSSAELTGAVELAGPTRVSVDLATTELRFSGPIAGDSVEFYNPKSALSDAGTVVYAAANTYTGRTELVRTTLVLEPEATAGTGELLLDGGELIVSYASDQTNRALANRLRGAGTVKIVGPRNCRLDFAAVPADDPFYQRENTLDLNGRNRTVNSLAAFSSVTSSGEATVHLSVLNDAEGSFTGTVASNVILHYGSAFTRGLSVFVHRP